MNKKWTNNLSTQNTENCDNSHEQWNNPHHIDDPPSEGNDSQIHGNSRWRQYSNQRSQRSHCIGPGKKVHRPWSSEVPPKSHSPGSHPFKEEDSHGRTIWRGIQNTGTGQAPFPDSWGWSHFIQVSRFHWCWCWSFHVVEDKWEQVSPCCKSCTRSSLCPRNFSCKWENFIHCRGHCKCKPLSPCCRQCWQAYLLTEKIHNRRWITSCCPILANWYCTLHSEYSLYLSILMFI